MALFLLCLGATRNAFAESTITCHCFLDRSYNEADRFASDDYILATSFNSLLSKSFVIPKRQVVMIKMNEGVAQDELLIGLRIAKITGIDIRKFLGLRRENNSWPQIIANLSQQEGIKQDGILEAIRTGLPIAEAGVRIADEMIAEFFQVPPAEIVKFRTSGLNEKEMALLFILAHVSEIQPEALVAQYKTQGRSWSEIAHNLGLEPEAAGKMILAYPDKKIPR